MYIGDERLRVGGGQIALTVNDFWRWAYSDLLNKQNRTIFADFLVATSLEERPMQRQTGQGYDILWTPDGEGIRVNVKAGAYTEALEMEHPDHIQIRLSEYDEPHSCDVIVFCIFRAMSQYDSPLDMELWDFYTASSRVLYRDVPDRRVITLPALMELEPVWSDYYGIGTAIQKAMTAR